MELHKVADAAQRNIIHDAARALARFGECESRMRKVAELPLTFGTIMGEVRNIVRCTGYMTEQDVLCFRRTLHRIRRAKLESNSTSSGMCQAMVKGNDTLQDLPFKPLNHSAEVGTDARGMCYEQPNGGKRIIPSIYTRLKDRWMRANGVIDEPGDMNEGHLENSIKLLHESHGNVVARATSLLGKMANHFQNEPELVKILEIACLQMQHVDVATMYPVFNTLAKELTARRTEHPEYKMMYNAPDESWIDGALNWED